MRILLAFFLVALVVPAASAQTADTAAPESGIVGYSHTHLNITNVDAHKKFWAETLGGTITKVNQFDAVKFPGVLVLFRPQTPTGGSEVSIVTHMGFSVQNAKQLNAKLKAAGYKLLKESDKSGLVVGPDDVVVELIESASITAPIVMHHIHFLTDRVEEMQAWYAKTFDGKLGKRGQWPAVDVPGVNLSWMPSEKPTPPSKGRVIDHISFEIKNLEAFYKILEQRGVKFERPYTKNRDTGIGAAFFTDPFGVTIELTEGLVARFNPPATPGSR
jgi:catechol 2,3-dioxygenase-like lactoylglutathione lyase family enzyme